MITENKEVIEINGVYHYLDNALAVIISMVCETGVICDHPDSPVSKQASDLLDKMNQQGLLSDKVSAIIEYDIALSRIQQYLEVEKGVSDVK